MMHRLTDADCRNAQPGIHPDGTKCATTLNDGGGLYLRIAPGGSKSWIYRYMLNGARHDIGCGPYPIRSLKDAREHVKSLQRQVKLDHVDVPHSRIASVQVTVKPTPTFAAVTEKYLRSTKAAAWGPKQATLWRQSLVDYAYPILGNLPIDRVDRASVLRVLEPIWLTKPQTASSVRARIERVIGMAIAEGDYTGSNPAGWKGNLDASLSMASAAIKKNRVHHEALPWRDLPGFMAELRQVPGARARAAEFVILTGVRASELVGDDNGKPPATWQEIDLDRRLWIIPGSRMKNGQEHEVPLTPATIALLGSQNATAPLFSLPTPRAKDKQMRRVIQQLRQGITVHGFRSTFADWAAEHGFSNDLIDLALAHDVGNEVSRAYRRTTKTDPRRELMGAWSDFCNTEILP